MAATIFVLVGLPASGALASANVRGALYAVTFNGKASETLRWHADSADVGCAYTGSQVGAWNIVDGADSKSGRLWLPAGRAGAAEGVLDKTVTHAPGATGQGVPQPAQVVEQGLGTADDGPQPCGEVTYAATLSHVRDRGNSDLTGGVQRGALRVSTSPQEDGAAPRQWFANAQDWHLTDSTLSDAPQFSYEQDNNGIGYGTSVPFAEVGKASFARVASPNVAVDPCGGTNAPGEPRPNCTGSVTVSGTYTFTKICEGTISYVHQKVVGFCGANGGQGKILIKKVRVSHRKHRVRISFKVRAPISPKGFQCKVDRGRFKRCKAPVVLSHLRSGRHSFVVRPVGGVITPAHVSFRV